MAANQPSNLSISQAAISNFGSAANDIFSYFADEAKAGSDLAEQQEYTLAGNLAFQNEQFTKDSTAIKESQENRQITQALGRTQAQVAGAGFAESGSALDILRSGAQQGALTKAVTSEQGLITEAGYEEQGESYRLMASAAGAAAQAEAAEMGALAGTALNLIGGVTALSMLKWSR